MTCKYCKSDAELLKRREHMLLREEHMHVHALMLDICRLMEIGSHTDNLNSVYPVSLGNKSKEQEQEQQGSDGK